MVAALILLGEGLRLGLMKISDMYAQQHVHYSALAPIHLYSCPTALKVVAI